MRIANTQRYICLFDWTKWAMIDEDSLSGP